MKLTNEHLTFLMEEEGFNVPWKVPPLETSGVTIGYGYDLGQVMAPQFVADWSALDVKTINILRGYCGPRNRGSAIRQKADRDQSLRQANIPKEVAVAVLVDKSWPKYWLDANLAFPGLDKLPPNAAFALTSLVYNRGGKVGESDWDHPEFYRREEMRLIREHYVPDGHLPNIANMLVIMARLWHGKGVPGLVKRRIREAVLVDPTVVDRLDELKALWNA